MNDPLGLEASGIPPELIAQLLGSNSRKKVAEAMLRQSMQAPEVQQPKGRFQGAVSPLEHLAKLTQGVVARGGMDRADAERNVVAAKMEQGRRGAMEDYQRQSQGAPEAGYTDTLGSEAPQGPIDPGMKADPRAAIIKARMSPYLQNAKFLDTAERDLNRDEEIKARANEAERLLRVKAELAKPAAQRDPEAVRLAQIANDPARPPAERKAAADALAKTTSHGPQTQVNVNTPIDNFKNERTLREEFTKASENFVSVRDAYTQVKDSLAGDISAPATLAGATKFMKMLDPTSVVRESELNMALKSTGLLDRFLNLHNLVAKGQILTPTQASEIQRIAGVLYQTAEMNQKRTTDYYTKLATDYKLEPARIVRDLSPPRKQDAPAGGTQVLRFDAQGNPI